VDQLPFPVFSICRRGPFDFNKSVDLKETIIGLNKKNPTGVFFEQQNISSIKNALKEFERNIDLIRPINCRKNSEKFSNERFVRQFKIFVSNEYKKFKIKESYK
jgi:hypothetical protein